MLVRKSAAALLYSVVLPIFIAAISFAAEFVTVEDLSVIDGDAVVIAANNAQIKIRLHGTDAPKKSRPLWQAIAAALKNEREGRDITVEHIDQRSPRGNSSPVFADSAVVNHAMAQAGMPGMILRSAHSDITATGRRTSDLLS